MRRSHDTPMKMIAKVFGALALAGASVIALGQLGALRRYARIRRMSRGHRHERPPSTISPSTEAPPRWGTSHWPLH